MKTTQSNKFFSLFIILWYSPRASPGISFISAGHSEAEFVIIYEFKDVESTISLKVRGTLHENPFSSFTSIETREGESTAIICIQCFNEATCQLRKACRIARQAVVTQRTGIRMNLVVFGVYVRGSGG
jgi:hypothetical protein